MPICVKSEIGQLRTVLLHRPGTELEYLSPSTMEELLFDDIPYLHIAQQEHDSFALLLRNAGVRVVYLEDLMTETLRWRKDLRELFVNELIRQAGNTAMGYQDCLREYLLHIDDEKELVLKTMSGILFSEIQPNLPNSLSVRVRSSEHFVVPPIPNLYFSRDAFACIGNGITLNRMHTQTRNRETIYGKYILTYHPDYAGQVPFYYTPDRHFSIEGGDILNLTPNVLCVGISQRTQPEAIEYLAAQLFSDERAEIDTILAFEIPRTRAFMHLDTVFTQIDYDKFTVYPGILNELRAYELNKTGRGSYTTNVVSCSLEQILQKYLGRDKIQLIPCGGGNQITAEREQWSDGSNTLCIAPGKVIVYDRNYITNKILEEAGVCVLKTGSSELSRGRGGPRCMSMPLEREPLN